MVAGGSIALSEHYLHKFLTYQERRQPQRALWRLELYEYLNGRLSVLLSLRNNDTSGLMARRLVQLVSQCYDALFEEKITACYRKILHDFLILQLIQSWKVVVDIPEGCAAIQRGMNSLEKMG